MIEYEKERSRCSEYVYHQSDENLKFNIHIHKSFEFITITEGELELTVDDGKKFMMNKNDCALILPNQAHQYFTPKYSKSYLCIFSTDYVPSVLPVIESKTAATPVFKLDDCESFIVLLNAAVKLFDRKSLFYYLIHLFLSNTELIDSDRKLSDFVAAVICFIQKYYSEEISLVKLAESLGYDYNYTSNLFNKIFKTNFIKLVNETRIEKACQLLLENQMDITVIANRCGFNSIRSFNRNFVSIKKQTPTKFRKYNKS